MTATSPAPGDQIEPTGSAPVDALSHALSTSTVTLAATAAAAVAALSSTGSALVVAVLVGVASRDRRVGAVAALAATVAAIRFGSLDLGALAGAQEVLGPAGIVGPSAGAAASWTSAIALIGAVRSVDGVPDRFRRAPAAAAGILAAALVWGPGPSALGSRLAATLVGAALGVGASVIWDRIDGAGDRPRQVALLVAVLAVALAGVAV